MQVQWSHEYETLSCHAGKGLYGIYANNDTTFSLICKNVDYLDAKSGQPIEPCLPKPAPSSNFTTCSSTRINGLPGTGYASAPLGVPMQKYSMQQLMLDVMLLMRGAGLL